MRLAALTSLAVVASARPFLPDLTSTDWAQIQSGFSVGAVSDLASNFAAGLADTFRRPASEYSGDDTQKTIWQQLNDDEGRFSKLIKILNFEEDTKKVIDKRQDGFRITFFAPDNDALKCPGHGDHKDDAADDLEAALVNEEEISLGRLSNAIDALEAEIAGDKGGDDDDDKKRKKEIFKKIAHYVLQYHVLPQDYDEQALAQNSTLATTLKGPLGGSAGHKLRVRVEKHLVPPSLKLNFYAKITKTHSGVNGIWHELDHALLPPLSIFGANLMLTEDFSVTAAGIQAAHGRHYLDWEYDREKSRKGKPVFSGSPAATFVAPTNKAWAALPEHLRLFLFSPHGRRALAKTFAYHYLPHQILFSEVYYHAEHKKAQSDAWAFDTESDEEELVTEEVFGGDDPSFKREIDAETGLKGKKLHFAIEKKKLLPVEGAVKVDIKVNGKDLRTIDVPASNGAWHAIDEVLCPPHDGHKGHEGNDAAPRTWDNWEE